MEQDDRFENNSIELQPKINYGSDEVDGWNDHHTVPFSREAVRENLKCHGYCCPRKKCDSMGCTRCCCCFDCWYNCLNSIVGPKRRKNRPETIQEWFRIGLFIIQYYCE